MRLGKDLDAPMSEAGDDYGDYSKFESNRNSVVEKNDPGLYDDGSEPFLRNYQKMMTEMDNYEGDKLRKKEDESVKQVMSNMDVPDFRKHLPNNEMLQELMNQRLKVDWKQEYDKFQAEKEMISTKINKKNPYNGRLSPIAKERIYRLYLKGATPKELSLRFGILPDRVKAVVF